MTDEKTMKTNDDGPKESALETPGPGLSFPLTTTPIGPRLLRESGIPPLHASSTQNSTKYWHEFILGLRLLAENTVERPLRPQQGVIFDVCSATDDRGRPLYEDIAITLPRRATKSSSVWALAMGRCLARPGYKVALTAQTGTAARTRWLDDVIGRMMLEEADQDLVSRIKINRSNGHEKMTFKNGSSFVVLPPKESSFRGAGFDLVLIDEAQEFDDDEADALDSGIRPSLDTKAGGGQVIILGTAGSARSGLLWNTLELGRQDPPEAGIVEYAVPDGITADNLLDANGEKDWDIVRPLALRAHPGISPDDDEHPLTTEKIVRKRYMKMPVQSFAREYLGIWPISAQDAFLSAETWTATATQEPLPTSLPAEAVLGIATHPDGLSASIVAAWRDEDGKACLLLSDQRQKIDWLVRETSRLAKKYKVRVAHDTAHGPVQTEVEALKKVAAPRPVLIPVKFNELKLGHAQLVKDITSNNVTHWGQSGMTEAIGIVTKRTFSDRGGWLLARPPGQSAADITPLEAAALALLAFDTAPKKMRMRVL
jgi:hypothetical protein